mgnify:FL=1
MLNMILNTKIENGNIRILSNKQMTEIGIFFDCESGEILNAHAKFSMKEGKARMTEIANIYANSIKNHNMMNWEEIKNIIL